MTKDKGKPVYYPLALSKKLMPKRSLTREEHYNLREAYLQWYSYLFGKSHSVYEITRKLDEMEFVDYKMDKEQQAAAQEWAGEDPAMVLALMNDVVDDGYRISTTYDHKNACVIVSVMGKESDNPNFGLCMTSRHRDIYQALVIAMFKTTVLFGDKPWKGAAMDNMFG